MKTKAVIILFLTFAFDNFDCAPTSLDQVQELTKFIPNALVDFLNNQSATITKLNGILDAVPGLHTNGSCKFDAKAAAENITKALDICYKNIQPISNDFVKVIKDVLSLKDTILPKDNGTEGESGGSLSQAITKAPDILFESLDLLGQARALQGKLPEIWACYTKAYFDFFRGLFEDASKFIHCEIEPVVNLIK